MSRFHIIFLITFPCSTIPTNFIFMPSNRLSDAESWLNSRIPCIGDNVRFDDSRPVTSYIDRNLDAESIILPPNGVLYFSEHGVDLGGKANWQCAKSQTSNDVFFSPQNDGSSSFYDPENWEPDNDPFLHINQIPAEIDTVIIPETVALRMYIDQPIRVNKFSFYKRQNMTTFDFNKLLQTMEGQFQFELSRRFAKESDIGDIQRLLARNAIIVNNQDIHTHRNGIVSSNSDEKILQQICFYVKCSQDDLPFNCIDHFVPFGHCCPVCGAKIDFAAHDLSIEAARSLVEKVISLNMIEDQNSISIERTTMDPLSPNYQIIIATKSNGSFQEELYKEVTNKIIRNLRNSMITEHGRSILKITGFFSKRDSSVRLHSKIIGCVIYFSILIMMVFIYISRNYKFHIQRIQNFAPKISWKRLEEGDDQVSMELFINTEASAEESEEENINPNYVENQTTTDIKLIAL